MSELEFQRIPSTTLWGIVRDGIVRGHIEKRHGKWKHRSGEWLTDYELEQIAMKLRELEAKEQK
jgi:hypothetical protein